MTTTETRITDDELAELYRLQNLGTAGKFRVDGNDVVGYWIHDEGDDVEVCDFYCHEIDEHGTRRELVHYRDAKDKAELIVACVNLVPLMIQEIEHLRKLLPEREVKQ